MDGARHYADVTVRHPRANRYRRRAAREDGYAARCGEADKLAAYPAVPDAGLDTVQPFALESFGRLGPAALSLLRSLRQRLAEAAPALRGWAGRAVQERWHAQLSVALHTAQFAAASATWGSGGEPRACTGGEATEDIPLLWAALPFADRPPGEPEPRPPRRRHGWDRDEGHPDPGVGDGHGGSLRGVEAGGAGSGERGVGAGRLGPGDDGARGGGSGVMIGR